MYCQLFQSQLQEIQAELQTISPLLEQFALTGKVEYVQEAKKVFHSLKEKRDTYLSEYKEKANEILLAWYPATANLLKKRYNEGLEIKDDGRAYFKGLLSLASTETQTSFIPSLFKEIQSLTLSASVREINGLEKTETIHGRQTTHLSMPRLRRCGYLTLENVEKIAVPMLEEGNLSIHGPLDSLDLPSFTKGSLETDADYVIAPKLVESNNITLKGVEYASFPSLLVANINSTDNLVHMLDIPQIKQGILNVEADEIDISETEKITGSLSIQYVGEIKGDKLKQVDGSMNIRGMAPGTFRSSFPVLEQIGTTGDDIYFLINKDQKQEIDKLKADGSLRVLCQTVYNF